MGSRRGAANLERFNAERAARVGPLLEHELQLCRKRKLQFKSVGMLAAYLSDRLKIHRTTFLRNLKYRAMLLEFLSAQPGAVSRVPDTTLDVSLLQAKLASARLEASNLRQELKQLKAQVNRGAPAQGSETGAAEQELGNLAMLLVNVMGRVADSMVVNYRDRSIVDLAAKPSERVVAGPERAGQFIAWLEQNQAIPAVGRLMELRAGAK